MKIPLEELISHIFSSLESLFPHLIRRGMKSSFFYSLAIKHRLLRFKRTEFGPRCLASPSSYLHSFLARVGLEAALCLFEFSSLL